MSGYTRKKNVSTSIPVDTLEELEAMYPTADSTANLMRLVIADGIAARKAYHAFLVKQKEKDL